MKAQRGYVPPQYIPLQQEDNEFESNVVDGRQPSQRPISQPDPVQWSSGICACCDDMPSCCIGGFCPCFLFAKNAEFLGSGTLAGSCMTHFVLWGLVNSLCCLCTGGILFGLTGSVVACYAGGYRRALRAKYNLPEAPCGDCATHVCCHLCAICQEYREIRERSQGSSPVLGIPVVIAPEYREIRERSQGSSPVLGIPVVIAPPIQTMGMDPPK